MTSIAAIVCAHTLDRWGDINKAVDSLRAQTRPADEIVLVIDHNPELLQRAEASFGTDATIVANTGARGVSAARNSAAEVTTSDVLAYLDDDAVADERWIETLLRWYDDPEIVGVGGTANPAWDGPGPAWFPPSFNWVVGCSHSGIAPEPAPVRNFIGCNMSVRRSAWEAVDGFYDGLGRVGADAGGGDETDFCIRVTAQVGGVIMNDPAAVVSHRVPADRQTLAYLVRRCRSEGRAKAHLSDRAGSATALAAERDHLRRTLPRELLAGLRDALRGDLSGLGRSAAILIGTAATALGYLEGRVRRSPSDQNAAFHFVPAQVASVDLDEPLPDLEPDGKRLFAIVRRGPKPLGVLRVDHSPSRAELEKLIAKRFADASGTCCNHLETAADAASLARTAAVVVATRDRTDSLRRCLESLAASSRVPDQVIVADSAPADELTAEMIAEWNGSQDLSIGYVRADRPGLAVAHNAALPLVHSDVVAFTDDDVIVDRHWLGELVGAFDRAPDVACVTGAIMPAEIETWPQEWVESTTGFNKGHEPRIFDLETNRPDDPLFPFTAGSMGSGANMAFDTAWLKADGGFDEALGTGTVALGGDDLRSFYDVVTSGHQLVYAPSAMIFHHHHRTDDAIARQCYGYGAGLSAFLTSVVVDDPAAVLGMVKRAPGAIRHAVATTAPDGGDTFPGQAQRTRRQRAGMVAGVVRYLRSRKHV